ncbi:MAG TPA: glycosyltransferase family 4 protein, partial [Victivallales bacterium]|nr:glycosyltransferase family 4 protein [Victivallales bacterium]
PNMVHIFGKNYVTAAATHYAISNSIPLLIELCNEMSSTQVHVPFPIRFFLNLSPKDKFKYVCISERLKRVCLSEGISEENLWCRPNPVDENKFFPVSSEQKLELRKQITGWGADVRLLCYVAKVIPRKNHIMLIDVIEKLPDNYRLFMGGPTVSSGIEHERDSALVEKIKQEISERKLNSKIIFKTGFFKNIDQLYKMSDVYLFPTKEEGLGTPLLEAVSCAVPVVANTIDGITDTWIENGRNGYLSKLDPDDFALKIIKAECIPRCNLLEAARKMINIAGISAIDQEYINIINSMASSEQ